LAKKNSTKWLVGLSSVLLFTGLVDFTQQSDQNKQTSLAGEAQGNQSGIANQAKDGAQQEWQSSRESDQADSSDQENSIDQTQPNNSDQLNTTDQSSDLSSDDQSFERPQRRTRVHTRAS
jgi:hypothetical protein